MNKFLIILFKKTEVFSALACRLTVITGKSNLPIHPKHLIKDDQDIWYKKLLTKKSIVLDAGSGSGQHSISLARYVKKIIGLDHDYKNIEIAKKSAKEKNIKNVNFLYADLETQISLGSRTFNLAILFDVLEHIHNRQFFLKEIKRVLVRGGSVIVAIPNNDSAWKKSQRKYGLNSFSDPDHKIEYTKNTIKKELEMAGFKILDIKPISYDTPWNGLIDLVGGFSLSLYKSLSNWKKNMLDINPNNCSGYLIIAKTNL